MDVSISDIHQNKISDNSINKAFAELWQLIYNKGLLESSPYFYIRKIVGIFILLAISIMILITIQSFLIQIFNAVLLAFTFGQIGFFLHDVGHGQVIGSRFYGLINPLSSSVMGLSLDWWVQKHNRHHAYPNQEGYDPDIMFKFFAFSKKQVLKKGKFYKAIIKRQHILFLPILTLEVWNLRCASIKYLFKQGNMRAILNACLIVLHVIGFIFLLVISLPIEQAVVFVILHWGLLGIYLGTSFAPNHKGMPILEHGVCPGFIEQQVPISRNVRGGWIVDFLYGGLNYQIEHHLFPAMPRNHLKHAAVIVEKFCNERFIPYHSVSIAESYREIFRHFARIGNSI